jgi:hypothetical protein
MTDLMDPKQKLMKALGFWLAGFAVVAGYMYYHSTVPLGPVLIAGILTLLFTIYKARKP